MPSCFSKSAVALMCVFLVPLLFYHYIFYADPQEERILYLLEQQDQHYAQALLHGDLNISDTLQAIK